MTLTCACSAPLGQHNKSGRCRSCVAKRKYADPAQRAKMSKAKKAAMRDPAKRARVAVAAAENFKRWHRETDRDWSAWHRQQRLGWCPEARLQEYTALRLKVGAVEARRMIEETIPGTRAHAQREIASSQLAMKIRAGREKAQAY